MQHLDPAEAEDFARIRDVQVDNVLRILEDSLGRIKISLILPRMVADLDHVERQLQGTLYQPAIEHLKAVKRLDAIDTQMFNIEVLRIIDYFHRNFKMNELFPRYLNNLSTYDKTLLFAFETILSVARRHLERTSKAEINMERQLYVMYQEREETKARNESIRKKLKSKYAALRWKQGVQFVILEKHESDLANRKWKNNVRIQNEIEKRGRILRENHKQSLIRQKELEEELEQAKAKFELLVKNNAAKEKEIRGEKSKLLIQLENILHKYDSSVCEKLRENLELEDMFKVAKKELDEFMVLYRKEEAVYKNIVVKYEKEEQRKQQQRILLYMMNRAARKIQRYWQKWRKDQAKRARKARKSKKK
ncbi:PREDICTED: uncharacterized protein LOC108615071 [Drosophila arizonae]|uniref:Dynein regulatory complex protein 10 n=1 Tax=Drosophila arizonae TaxID=7263 RepID=A0ABM1PC59_DROAR|nr:PREDICTED: uncharacterized protein LOC108615071 [Drosophila arizonae]